MGEFSIIWQFDLPQRHDPYELTQKVVQALENFRKEYGFNPTSIELNPYILEMFGGVNTLDGIPLTSDHFVFRNQVRLCVDKPMSEMINERRRARNVTIP